MTGRMHEVELIEEPAHPERSTAVAPDDTAAHPSVTAARGWLRRRARWLLPAAGVLVAALVGTQLLLDHRESRLLAALAAIPGVVRPVDPSLGVLWRADPELAPALQSGALVEGVLVGGIQDTAGAPVLVGLDPDTGAVDWTTPVDAQPPSPGVELWITCTAVPHGESHVAGCIAQQFGPNVQGTPSTSVWVLDPTNGRLLLDRSVDGGSGLTFARDQLVVSEPVAAGGTTARWTVTAQDVVTGRTRWTWRTPPTTVADRTQDPDAAAAATYSALQAQDDLLVLGVDRRAWILTTDGDLRLDEPLEAAGWLQPLRAGVFLESSWTPSDLYRGTLLLPDGSEVPVDETGGWLAVDDGSAPDVVVTVGEGDRGPDGISGRSASTGDLLWHVAGSIASSLLLDGIVYVATVDDLVAVDAESGDVLWRTALDHVAQQLFTDGRYLLVPGLGVTLEAYTLSDGELAWTTDLSQEVAGDRPPSSVRGFQSGGNNPRLYAWMDDGAVAVLG